VVLSIRQAQDRRVLRGKVLTGSGQMLRLRGAPLSMTTEAVGQSRNVIPKELPPYIFITVAVLIDYPFDSAHDGVCG
jgi:hypothetical protein